MDTQPLQAALPAAVDAMRKHMVARQQEFSASMHSRLQGTLQNLETLQSAQIQQLELRLAANKQDEAFKKGRREKRTQQIRRVFDEYRQWVEDTMSTEPQPFIQVLAAATR
jgi:predicted RNase H-like nuclease (RuvC/YqgF family)